MTHPVHGCMVGTIYVDVDWGFVVKLAGKVTRRAFKVHIWNLTDLSLTYSSITSFKRPRD
jgi:hypothetical protein